ncbi:MAG: MG2 domain-containing protein [Algibacter sp.]
MKNALILLMIIFFSNFSQAQTPNYDKLWEKVERLEIDGLPKSALEVVETIEKQAKKDKNDAQLIKIMLFKSKFALVLEEDAQLKIINDFKSEIAKSEFPTKNILENILANLYWQYFNQNRWQFYNRTKTSEKVDNVDFRTWDLQTLFNEIHVHYQNALQNGLMLQLEDLKDYDAILSGQKDSKIYRPTLFDFLSHNSLEFYKTNETHITKPSYKFEIDDVDYLGDAITFSQLRIRSKDSTSLQLNALKIYQSLINSHVFKASPYPSISVDLERLKFVHQHTTLKNKDELLLKTLKSESEKSKTYEFSSLYDFEIASIYYKQSQQYQPKASEESRWKAKDAIDICSAVISKFPESDGAKKCAILKSQIAQNYLQITTEDFLPIQKDARLLVRYKNLDQLDFKVFKMTRNQLKKFNETYRKEDQKAFIEKLDILTQWESKLPNEEDYQMHTTEVLFPKLDNGSYIVYASQKDSGEAFAFSTIQVTNIALVESNDNENQTFQFIDRNNGKPLKEAKVKLNYYKNNQRSYSSKNYVTDSHGEVKIKKENNRFRNINIEINANNETAYFGDFYINRYYKQDKEKTIYDAFTFTDRSIYRPAQTVYFKSILIKKDGTKSTPFANENVFATLYNTNSEKVADLDLESNEFGSVSGEFILPNTGLNGQYYIEIYTTLGSIRDHHYFSVEEYKRPKFQTKFNPVTETFKVNDSVTVKGHALAYAGSNITDAKVVYRVHRKVEYPRWYFWYRPQANSESQEITHGESATNSKGEFEITFKAQPDSGVDKTSLPIFKYEVTADVTDLNGETRSATTSVNVGYHALIANIEVDSNIDKSKKDKSITIDTKNLNGEFIAAKGTIKIYKLEAPKYVLRTRPWAAPDYKSWSKEEFKALFPNDAYDDEHSAKNWKKGDLVLEKTFNTKDSETLKLGKLKKWQSGEYIITLESKDKFGQLVKDEVKTILYSDSDKTLADNQLFSITTNKDTYNPNETVILKLASAANPVTVSIHVEKKNQVVQTHSVELNANKKTISIPVTTDDIGGFTVHYSFAVFNNFQSGSLNINVPYPKTELEIETTTFRDKLQPGTDETWRFKIKGPQGDKVSAELLASMYDASLDQIKPHKWNFNPIDKLTYYSYNRSRANQSFGTKTFRIYSKRESNINHSNQSYDRLNWFGFSINNNRYIYNSYLRQLKSKYETKYEAKFVAKYDSSLKKGFVFGRVTDENGEPLSSVNIIVKGTTRGVQTDFEGNFSIEAKKGEILNFSYIGYLPGDFTINKNNSLSVSMILDNAKLDEVVVAGYSTVKKSDLTGSVSRVTTELLAETKVNSIDIESVLEGKAPGISVRGVNSSDSKRKPLYIVDGVIIESAENLNPADIDSVEILKAVSAIALYGNKGGNGVILITTKKTANALTQVKVRKNLNETAFFFPQLQTDKDDHVSFSFTTPEALTKWKLQLLAHTKTLESATKTLTTVTQKELMVIPNAPRFLREGDNITISTKIANLTNNQLSGNTILQLFDAVSGKDISKKLLSSPLSGVMSKGQRGIKTFTVDAKGNTQASWSLTIPDDVQAVQYKVIAKAGNFSDGEQNALPVLSNRMLVTETLPMWIRSNQTKTFTLDKLKNTSTALSTDTSTTLKNHKLTLEMTSNPAWYAVQALPYLMEYPHECNEQTFSRYYANALASHIANSNPRIQDVFNQWRNTDALLSNLEKNQELKSILIQETPWLRDAQSETEQKKRIALLFDLNKMNNELQSAIKKLEHNQMSSGAWSWFNGGHENRYITQHIINGFGHLKQLKVDTEENSKMISKAIKYLDSEFVKEYKDIRKYDKDVDLNKDHLSYTQLHYLYMRSFYPDVKKSKEVDTIIDYYQTQIQKYWISRSLYSKGLMALVSHRNKDSKTTSKILKSLKENSITSDELGMYWKANTNSWFWYQAPIETQALLIETFSEAGHIIQSETKNLETIDNLKIWLLKNKQTNRWKTTKATTEAVYALLLQGSDWLSVTDMVDVVIGGQNIAPLKLENVKVEAGTGYYKTSWNTTEIKPEMGEVTLTKKGNGIAWGSLYWQYFEDLDKITSAETPLKLKKKLFLKTNTDTGEEITEITKKSKLKVGDLVRVRIELRSDRNMEFLHMKDMRASGLEPVNVISKYKWQDGLGYYESTKDASTNFFFDYLPKGVYVFEYDLRINNAGDMSNGITTIQSMYAPEFSSHSEGARLSIK